MINGLGAWDNRHKNINLLVFHRMPTFQKTQEEVGIVPIPFAPSEQRRTKIAKKGNKTIGI
jgi:hypothetical protein